MGVGGQLGVAALVGVAGVAYCIFSATYGGDKQVLLDDLRALSQRLGPWSLPLYVALHALLISLCLPYALLLEAGAAYLFGFFNGVLCVFSAKILSASLSFWIGRTLFRSSSSARHWVESNKIFSVISNGVARDGWKFVLLARFSPIPSYVINYSLAATNVRKFETKSHYSSQFAEYDSSVSFFRGSTAYLARCSWGQGTASWGRWSPSPTAEAHDVEQ